MHLYYILKLYDDYVTLENHTKCLIDIVFKKRIIFVRCKCV